MTTKKTRSMVAIIQKLSTENNICMNPRYVQFSHAIY